MSLQLSWSINHLHLDLAMSSQAWLQHSNRRHSSSIVATCSCIVGHEKSTTIVIIFRSEPNESLHLLYGLG